MAVPTITGPTAEQIEVLKMRHWRFDKTGIELDPSQNYALLLVPLAPGVTQDDYPALAQAIDSIQGLGLPQLIVDWRMPDTVLPNRHFTMHVGVQLEMPRTPEPPE